MESEPTPPATSNRRPSGSSARRGSASAASRARSGAARVVPPRPAEVQVEPPSETDEGVEVVEVAEEVTPVRAAKAKAARGGAKSKAKSAPVVEPEAEPEPAPIDEPEPEPIDQPESQPIDQPESQPIDQPESQPGSEDADAVPAPAKSPRAKRRPVRVTAPESPASGVAAPEVALSVQGLTKYFGDRPAVDGIDLEVAPGSFYGIVGPNGAGKTTTLSMITGLLRPDGGVVRVFGLDVWHNATLAKRTIGVLPDRLRLFDRLTGAEFLHHAGALRGLDRATIAQRSADLSAAFGLDHSLHRLVSDYSAGMTKKIAIAAAMIHAPRLLVLDEPFESVDPVSTAVVLEVLTRFTEAGGTVILSSHSMELTERVCDALAIIADGAVLAEGPIAEVLAGQSLEQRFVELAGGEAAVEGMEWLQNFSD